MPNRIIKSAGRKSSLHLTDCLSSLLALELLSPSLEVYLFSPWISDVPLLESAFGQFRSVLPDLEHREAKLSEILNSFAARGSHVHVMYHSKENPTQRFLNRLTPSIEIRQSDTLHEKGLVGAHFYLRGSMNFTYSGVNLNDEHVELTTELHEVALALAEAKKRWGA